MAADQGSGRAGASARAASGPPGRPTMPVAGGGTSGVLKRQGVSVGGGGRRAAAGAGDTSGHAPERGDGDLIIGEGVRVTGEVRACERLVVAGRVEAALPAGTLEVRDTGTFRGEATVRAAFIAGAFEGTLTVSGTLALAETARVRGQIRYASLEVAAGGELCGDVDRLTAVDGAAEPAGGESEGPASGS